MVLVSLLTASLLLGAWGLVHPSSLVRSDAAGAGRTERPADQEQRTRLQAPPEDDLPEGEGKKILLASCTTCHDLAEVTKLRGYYTRAQWRDVVVTMKEYGAKVDDKQVEILTDYLTLNLGKK